MSRAVTPATIQDEDSFSSTPPGRTDTRYHGPDEKREELMRLLAEVSSSSGEEDDMEEEGEEGEEDVGEFLEEGVRECSSKEGGGLHMLSH